MPIVERQVRLAPFGGLNAERVSEVAINSTMMRAGFNVEPVDNGEWWTRKGEEIVGRRWGSMQWVFVGMAGAKWVIANPYHALQMNDSSPESGVTNMYTPTATESVTLTHGSALAVSTAHTGLPGELLLVGTGFTDEVYRVTAGTGTDVTLERPYEGESGNYTCRFLPQLAKNAAGTDQGYFDGISGGSSYIVWEQLVSHSAGDVHATSPALIAGRRYLVITSTLGVPVAIDIGTVTGVKRNWFYNTALSSPVMISSANGYGTYAETYENFLFIAAAPDDNNRLAARTIWWSGFGDLLTWHTGIAGQFAVPNFKTFNSPNNDISGIATLHSDIVVHRQRSQEIGTITRSPGEPFHWRANNQNLGLYKEASRLLVNTRNAQFLWTTRGPAVFDGSQIQLIAPEIYRDLVSYKGAETPNISNVVHDEQRGRLYWYFGELSFGSPNRHQDATLPPSVTRLAASGSQYPAAKTVLVHDYESNRFWWEDRTSCYGGGWLGEPGIEVSHGVYMSRFDGSIVKLRGMSTGKDAGIADPTEDHVVECQVDTPWTTLDTMNRKEISKVEVTLRALDVTAETLEHLDKINDVWGSTSDRIGLRLQIFGDNDESTALDDGDLEASYSVSEMLAMGLADNRQFPTMKPLVFTPNCAAQTFKFRFSNVLTPEAQAAGIRMAPFRLSDVSVYYVTEESYEANAIANG